LGVAEAMNNIGNAYHHGKGVKTDLGKAFEWYSRARENGLYLGAYNLGVMYYFGEGTGKSYEKAYECFKEAAEKDYSQAQYNLAGMYYYGEGTEKNIAEAYKWYKKAAENGYSEAWISLGEFYLKGEGVEQDDEKALHCFEKSAEDGDNDARFEAARILFSSKGLEDYNKAAVYLTAAAEEGHVAAANMLGVVLVSPGLEIKKPLDALKWFEYAGNKGNRAANLNRATFYKKGEATSPDYNMAYHILSELTAEGDEIASFNLALLLLSGLGGKKDINRAEELLKSSSQKGWKAATDFISAHKLQEGPTVINQWTPYFLTDVNGEPEI